MWIWLETGNEVLNFHDYCHWLEGCFPQENLGEHNCPKIQVAKSWKAKDIIS
jgi:hypothetical protein